MKHKYHFIQNSSGGQPDCFLYNYLLYNNFQEGEVPKQNVLLSLAQSIKARKNSGSSNMSKCQSASTSIGKEFCFHSSSFGYTCQFQLSYEISPHPNQNFECMGEWGEGTKHFFPPVCVCHQQICPVGRDTGPSHDASKGHSG